MTKRVVRTFIFIYPKLEFLFNSVVTGRAAFHPMFWSGMSVKLNTRVQIEYGTFGALAVPHLRIFLIRPRAARLQLAVVRDDVVYLRLPRRRVCRKRVMDRLSLASISFFF